MKPLDDAPDPSEGKPYLVDANYYRLGYQLAAQEMHLSQELRGKSLRFEKTEDILYGPRTPVSDPERITAQEAAESFKQDAEDILRWYDERETELEAKERRLHQFLCCTVQPCLEILIAAARCVEEPAAAEEQLKRLRARAEPKDANGAGGPNNPLSYRALYNLACYEVSRHGKSGEDDALRYLRGALRRAPGRRRRELARWARSDPSLGALHDSREFKDLIKPHQQDL